jgi:hypothetical protein
MIQRILNETHKIWSFHADWMQWVFSCDQPCKYGVTILCIRDCLCLHHQGWCDELHDCYYICTHDWLSEPCVLVCELANGTVGAARWSVIRIIIQSMLLNLDIPGYRQQAVMPLITSTLMMETETISRTSDCNSILMRPIAQEDSIVLNETFLNIYLVPQKLW